MKSLTTGHLWNAALTQSAVIVTTMVMVLSGPISPPSAFAAVLTADNLALTINTSNGHVDSTTLHGTSHVAATNKTYGFFVRDYAVNPLACSKERWKRCQWKRCHP